MARKTGQESVAMEAGLTQALHNTPHRSADGPAPVRAAAGHAPSFAQNAVCADGGALQSLALASPSFSNTQPVRGRTEERDYEEDAFCRSRLASPECRCCQCRERRWPECHPAGPLVSRDGPERTGGSRVCHSVGQWHLAVRTTGWRRREQLNGTELTRRGRPSEPAFLVSVVPPQLKPRE